MFRGTFPKRRFFVPEVVQTSSMDCGPASLKSLLAGFDISVNYGRLREACMTDVDGTSIDTLEEISVALGLDAVQIMVPEDHLLLPEAKALPALVVIQQPGGLTHFIVLWRVHKNFVQVMDPSSGRSWWSHKRLLNSLYLHSLPVTEEFAGIWLREDDFIASLQARLNFLDIQPQVIEDSVGHALKSETWQAVASLDAAVRLTETLVRTKGIRAGTEAEKVLQEFNESITSCSEEEVYTVIPEKYWCVRKKQEGVFLHGAVLISVCGKKAAHEADHVAREGEDAEQSTSFISPEVSARFQEKERKAGREILRTVLEKGIFIPIILALTVVLSSIGTALEILLLKGLFEMTNFSELTYYRTELFYAVIAFFSAMLMLELSGAATALRIGQWLEIRFRVSILQKIPRLGDRYFHSRLTSDMAQRVYDLRGLRGVPDLAVTAFKSIFEIFLITAGIIWLNPSEAAIAVSASLFIIAVSLLTQSWLKEQDLRFRSHVGALSRFYLDALLGLVPIRTHRGERSISVEHESMLVKWSQAGMSFHLTSLAAVGMQSSVGTFSAVWILFSYLKGGGEAGGVLLLLYWVMKLPVLGQALAGTFQQYSMHHNRILRLLEMRDSSEEAEFWYHEGVQTKDSASACDADEAENIKESSSEQTPSGVSISMNDVEVHGGGHVLLRDITLKVDSGDHIAVVGPSGAGKSSFVGLLLGWHQPASGYVSVNNELLHGDCLSRLRKETAWVDPGVQLWNRSLEENLQYGTYGETGCSLSELMHLVDLSDVTDRLADDFSTLLGENGGLLSGGQGQRVRLGRALLRNNVRLVILDEPFRGLDRKKRREFLQRCRQYWRNATLFFVSHDIDEALGFNRVLVMDQGRIAEDGHPEHLVADTQSRYHALWQAERHIQQKLHGDHQWRHWVMDKGRLQEKSSSSVTHR